MVSKAFLSLGLSLAIVLLISFELARARYEVGGYPEGRSLDIGPQRGGVGGSHPCPRPISPGSCPPPSYADESPDAKAKVMPQN
ncbi:hypothetical protein FH972_006226 [Carpinus fangiana]|uniref:Uncharacterized protein n=1 Tax=Carpinus fangiana TaxID=176857 RepID=A0A5N6QUL0_9ROSI|nr:hypothetical protein FH972_006226 [Carpinus fangiana]